MLTGRPFTAREALEWGMVNRLCSAETLLPEALDTAGVIAGNAPISTRQLKQSVNMGQNMDLRSGMMFEIEAYNRMVPTEDRREGIRAGAVMTCVGSLTTVKLRLADRSETTTRIGHFEIVLLC